MAEAGAAAVPSRTAAGASRPRTRMAPCSHSGCGCPGHDAPVRLRGTVLLLALLMSLGLASGCQGDDTPKPATGPGLPSQAELKSYFEAITGADPDALARAQSDIAADGSPAQGYAAYVGAFAAAAAAGGQTADPVDVEEGDGGFKACIGDSPDQCATWSDLKGQEGRLTDFTINDTPLHELLVDLTGQPAIDSPGLYKVQPGWAYRQPKSGMLYVVLTITASDAALSPRPGIYVEQDQILKGVKAPSPTTIDAGTSRPVILAFPDAQDVQLDGQVTFNLGIEGASAEPIGFGL